MVTDQPGMPSEGIIDAIVSQILATGLFDSVNAHQGVSSPGTGMTGAVWVQDIEPSPRDSGLASVAVVFTVMARLYMPASSEPLDMVDPLLTQATDTLMGAYVGGFTLGGLVRNIDVLGENGRKLGAQYGYVTIEGAPYRCATITVPCVVNDPWNEEA